MNTTVKNLSVQLNVPQWLQFPSEVRIKLRDTFNISRSAGSEMQQIDGKSFQTSDGHTHADLQVITVEKLQDFTKSESNDFYELLQLAVDILMEVHKPSVEQLAKESSDRFISRVTNMLVTINIEAKDLGLEDEVKKLFALAHGKIENDTVPKKMGRPKKNV